MKKIFILFPILTLLVAGCSLTQKSVNNSPASSQSASTSQEQTNNLNAQIQEVKKEEIGKQVETPAETQLKKFVREKYSFYAPSEWIESSVILSGGNSNGCELYSINYGGDGHRTGGSIAIRTKSCFASLNLTSPINSNKENTEKNGYYIVAMYDSITGTTPSEELKTKEVYKKVVETFTLNNETTQIKVYFAKKSFSGCSIDIKATDLDYFYRSIPKTQAVARASIEELLKGPTQEENNNGYKSDIPDGTYVKSITITNGEALVDFNGTIENGVTSCGGGMRIWQIRQTLLQFPTIKTVKFSVDGRTEDIFQA